MTKDEALKLALEALIGARAFLESDAPIEIWGVNDKAITAIKEALAQPEQEPVAFEKTVCPFCSSEWVTAEQHDRNVDRVEQEPVAWMSEHRFDELRKGFTVMTTLTKQIAFEDDVALYTNPPQRTWVGLTDEEIKAFDAWHDNREEEVGWCNPSEIVAYIEAKLKEKNT